MAMAAADPSPAAVMSCARGLATLPATQTPDTLVRPVGVRSLQRADEYQRLLQLQALAVGFAVVVVLLQVASVLVAAQLMDARQGLQISFLGGLVAWLGVRALKARKS
jgi:hypothetical protein